VPETEWQDWRAAAAADPQFLEQLATVLLDRPRPIRTYDQIHMHIADLGAHILMLAPMMEGKRVFFMGDSDGLVLGLACAARLGIVPAPKDLLLCDFDKRVLQFVDRAARRFSLETLVSTTVYNVFDPLPLEFDRTADIFHTNPPYGQFNGGRSIMAFVERALAATRPGGTGVIVLANDERFPWTHTVLRSVVDELVARELTPYRILDRCHRYHLDDQPDLESGLILCADANPDMALDPNQPLPSPFAERFYGRNTVPIPRFIPLDEDEGQLDFAF
jgi:predicted RNA methylase